ncbi:hypothetical protein PRVXT_000642 [Proteinivorax tanatarense]|uniref:Uncharacterized protein n=1 Tax=Proteinivorax tanatarense TaxID=1260629 RepID=A0AAU7VMX5_9FIRM
MSKNRLVKALILFMAIGGIIAVRNVHADTFGELIDFESIDEIKNIRINIFTSGEEDGKSNILDTEYREHNKEVLKDIVKNNLDLSIDSRVLYPPYHEGEEVYSLYINFLREDGERISKIIYITEQKIQVFSQRRLGYYLVDDNELFYELQKGDLRWAR